MMAEYLIALALVPLLIVGRVLVEAAARRSRAADGVAPDDDASGPCGKCACTALCESGGDEGANQKETKR